jgi:hypothetical protein
VRISGGRTAMQPSAMVSVRSDSRRAVRQPVCLVIRLAGRPPDQTAGIRRPKMGWQCGGRAQSSGQLAVRRIGWPAIGWLGDWMV